MDITILSIFQLVVLIYSVVIHEVSHGLMAHSLGDDTAKNMGRLTLNPIKHLDMFGSFILPIITSFSGFIIGYAKPVPYNPHNLSDRRYGPAKVAFAGPAVNIVMAVLFGLTLRFLGNAFALTVLPELLATVVIINLGLAIFNLFPIPPLDGHWLLMAILPPGYDGVRVFLYRYSLFLLFVFIFFVFPWISPLISLLFSLITGLTL